MLLVNTQVIKLYEDNFPQKLKRKKRKASNYSQIDK